MKLKEAIELKLTELKEDYKDVIYSHNEIIRMKSNVDENKYISKELSLESEIEEIKNRFTELDKDNYIDAVILIFNVKTPRKRNYLKKEIYYRIVKEV